jgi:hypothetical protein
MFVLLFLSNLDIMSIESDSSIASILEKYENIPPLASQFLADFNLRIILDHFAKNERYVYHY